MENQLEIEINLSRSLCLHATHTLDAGPLDGVQQRRRRTFRPRPPPSHDYFLRSRYASDNLVLEGIEGNLIPPTPSNPLQSPSNRASPRMVGS